MKIRFYILYRLVGGRRVTGISRSLTWSKTLKELIFNPYGEFHWSPEGPVNQIHSPHLLVGVPGILSDLLRFVQMLKREWGAESIGKLPHLSIPNNWNLGSWVCNGRPVFWAELQPWCLSLQWRTCPWANTDDDVRCILSEKCIQWWKKWLNNYVLYYIKNEQSINRRHRVQSQNTLRGLVQANQRLAKAIFP